MQTISISTQSFKEPTRLCLEASWDVILDNDLDTENGEHYDIVRGVISINVTGDMVIIETCRTEEAWKLGLANAGRGTLEIPRRALEAIYAS